MLAVPAELVEIDTVCTCMREYTVKDNINAVCFCFLAKVLKVLIAAEHRIDVLIAGGRVAVIFVRLKDRI